MKDNNKSSVKALKKQLGAAVAMVCVAAVALGSSTYAWFASNNRVTATDMQVTAATSGSLVITKDALPTADTGTITVASSDTQATALIPTTHDLTRAITTGLIYNTNPGDVSSSTGLQGGNTELTFAEASNSDDNKYYLDYTVYIASSGQELTNQDIEIKLTNDAVTTLMGATSIDFYAANVSSASTVVINSNNFKGTLNLAGKDAATNDATVTKDTQTISNVTIPKSGSDQAIAVTMRVYVDGALKDTTETTYVRNVKVADISAQTLGVSFTSKSNGNE